MFTVNIAAVAKQDFILNPTIETEYFFISSAYARTTGKCIL